MEDLLPIWERNAVEKWSRPGAWITIGQVSWIIAGVAVCLGSFRALAFRSKLTDPGGILLFLVGVVANGPLVGFLLHRLWGGGGIKGAIVGGALWWCGAGIWGYAAYSWSPPTGPALLLEPLLAIPLLVAFGAMNGLLVGPTLRVMLGPPTPWRRRPLKVSPTGREPRFASAQASESGRAPEPRVEPVQHLTLPE